MNEKQLINQLVGRVKALERLVARLPARFARQAPVPTVEVGIVTCQGPDGEPDFTDNRYWVRRARIANTDNDPKSPLVYEAYPEDHPRAGIICVTNQFEGNEASHNVKPETRMSYWSKIDQGDEPLERYFGVALDEGDNGQNCASSNSSTATKCLYRWYRRYNYTTEEWEDVQRDGTMCIDPETFAKPLNTWLTWGKLVDGFGVKYCVHEYYAIGDFCEGVEVGDDTCRDSWPADPAHPAGEPDCESSSSSSNEFVCVHVWNVSYDEVEGVWGPITYGGVNCDVPPAVVDQWVKTNAAGCHYRYYKLGAHCPGEEQTEGCLPVPDEPDAPNFVPNCGSSSGSGSDEGSLSSGDCVEVLKDFDIEITCNPDGTITAQVTNKQYETVRKC